VLTTPFTHFFSISPVTGKSSPTKQPYLYEDACELFVRRPTGLNSSSSSSSKSFIEKTIDKRGFNSHQSNAQGSFPVGRPANGVPKVILTVGTSKMTLKPALGELYKKHLVCTKIHPTEIQNQKNFSGEGAQSCPRPLPSGMFPSPHPTPIGAFGLWRLVPPLANSGAPIVWFPLFLGNDPCQCPTQ